VVKILNTYKKIRLIPAGILVRKLLRNVFSINFFQIPQISNEEDFIFSNSSEIISSIGYLVPTYSVLETYKNQISARCDQLINHQMDILGSGLVKINESSENDDAYQKIDWQKDFKSGYAWDFSAESKSLTYGEINGVDVKVPWELGRLQHLIILCQGAVLYPAEDKYLNEYYNQVNDFIISNPAGKGIQWKSSMDVAIRSINLLFSYLYLKLNKISIDSVFEFNLQESLYSHLIFIYKNLEWNDGLRGNHYIFNLTGLIVLSLFFKNENSIIIQKFAISEFEKEIDYQFNKDGSNFEASTHYHFFTSEAVLLIEQLLNYNNSCSKAISSKVDMIKKFSSNVINKNNEIFQIGDNDSGYLLKFHPEDYLSDRFNNYSHISRFYSLANKINENNRFDDFGLYIFRSNAFHLSFRCGSLGQKGKGGHAHNDQLSICVNVNDQPLFVDIGTYCYTPQPILRNKFRSTESHNTMYYEGIEQNLFLGSKSQDLFWLYDKSKSEIIEIKDNMILAKHYGYGRTHSRMVNVNDDKLIIEDNSLTKLEKVIAFHFHPEFEIETDKDEILIKNVVVKLKLTSGADKVEVSEYDYSPAYGVIQKSKKILLKTQKDSVTTIIQLL
jgi:hypothetical protein